MSYSWEKQVLEKKGIEKVNQLIQQQHNYELSQKDNDCPKCGYPNEGQVIEAANGDLVLIHFGLWTKGQCDTCKKSLITSKLK